MLCLFAFCFIFTFHNFWLVNVKKFESLLDRVAFLKICSWFSWALECFKVLNHNISFQSVRSINLSESLLLRQLNFLGIITWDVVSKEISVINWSLITSTTNISWSRSISWRLDTTWSMMFLQKVTYSMLRWWSSMERGDRSNILIIVGLGMVVVVLRRMRIWSLNISRRRLVIGSGLIGNRNVILRCSSLVNLLSVGRCCEIFSSAIMNMLTLWIVNISSWRWIVTANMISYRYWRGVSWSLLIRFYCLFFNSLDRIFDLIVL